MQKEWKAIMVSLLALIFSGTSCRQMWGDHPLGNNLDLLEGDHIQDRVIVFCTGKSGGSCVSGIPVIPSYKDLATWYVQVAESNEKWVIAMAMNRNKSNSYWIINKNFKVDLSNYGKTDCDSILQSHVIGPLNFAEFQNKIQELKTELDFK
jgi:hypothetical protein